ncbi:hypothetical protein AWB80_07792 [Caballeronia pedi]|uniref:Uncharacterized protein n=1 Tax=Caballeronia pedi TaxID=1777141 RepID=A0A158DZR7_9BURK|nr:hypothetical protein [Caballeronia pedi]SAL00109.1 hypothetical protein AWB80_07792 [Caballeronia pedi]
MDTMQRMRFEAAAAANIEDASVWRWFSALLEERRIRWRFCFNQWCVNVDRRHVATDISFDRAIRAAKEHAEKQGLGLLHAQPNKAASACRASQ